MSGDNYYSFPPPPPPSMQIYPMSAPPPPPPGPQPNWSSWSLEQQEFNENFGRPGSNYPNNRNYYGNNSNRPPRNQRYPPPQHPQQYNNWNRNNAPSQKRQRPSNGNYEPVAKVSRKKKKPLSANMPKKEWSEEEAAAVIALEKEYNKRCGNSQLIIKFPDLELNRDIVTRFHPAIENVHFQQPSTPRFCFVTLKQTEDPVKVIEALNKVRFGSGCLTAEYKKDREDDQNVTPDEIDPHTLYVGNLAQEVTKEEMMKKFPNCKRIDIGYAKKMKYTRYAFVTFRNVKEATDAFKMSHNTQMYSKSLIVRFRRLHGTVGMPGEAKPVRNEPPSRTPEPREEIEVSSARSEHSDQSETIIEDESVESSTQLDMSIVKTEIDDDDFETTITDDSMIEELLSKHKPLVDPEIKKEIKVESEDADGPPSPSFMDQMNALEESTNQSIRRLAGDSIPPVKQEHHAEESSSDEDCMNFDEQRFRQDLFRKQN